MRVSLSTITFANSNDLSCTPASQGGFPSKQHAPAQGENRGVSERFTTPPTTWDSAAKHCPRCREWKPFDQFATRRDGRPQSYCRRCQSLVFREWLSDPANRMQYNRACAASKARYPEKERARALVRRAIQRGELTPQPCAVGVECAGRLEAHHPNHREPLQVVWLCRKHHDAQKVAA